MPTTQTDAGAEAEELKATTSQLLRLPPEIILMLASMLPTPSAACFALCSHLIALIR